MAHGSQPMIVLRRKQSLSSSVKPSARNLAYSILMSVEVEAAYASEVLRARLNPGMDSREAALTTELVMGVLRWKKSLDFFIERYTKRKTSQLDREVLTTLRLGIYQLRYLTRIPAHAAVSESVELAKNVRKQSAAPLVNAALRRAAEEKEQPIAKFIPLKTETSEALAIVHSHPAWLVERWLHNFGKTKTVALMESNNRTPEHACVFFDAANREKALESLEGVAIRFAPGYFLRDAIVVRGGNLAKTDAFRNGWIGMQDEASQIVPLLLDAKQDEAVLDLCAAPGGKTMGLARKVGEGGCVVASDLHEGRLRAMRERFLKAGARNIAIVALDGIRPLPFVKAFDRILVDAPCSGTGTLARNPEIRWRLKPEDLVDLHRRQVALLQSALKSLALDGSLLYSTCSLEPEENESVVREALSGDVPCRCERIEIPHSTLASGVNGDDLIDEDGAFHTFPPTSRTDGFFAALLRRV